MAGRWLTPPNGGTVASSLETHESSVEPPKRRLMYIEKKDGDIDGAAARIGWVTRVA